MYITGNLFVVLMTNLHFRELESKAPNTAEKFLVYLMFVGLAVCLIVSLLTPQVSNGRGELQLAIYLPFPVPES